MRIQGLASLVCAAILATASSVAAQPSAGTRMTPDGKQILISKDVDGDRWAISINPNDGTATGNVFFPDGRPPQFVWCERIGDDGSLDPIDGNIRYSCRGADQCSSSPCHSSEWVDLGEVDLPGSFLLPAADPFAPLRTAEHFCDPICHFPDASVPGEFVYSIDTTRCNYLTISQPSEIAIRPGDEIFIRLFHFALSAGESATSYVAFQIGDAFTWDARLPIPCDGGLVGFRPNADCPNNPIPSQSDPAEFTADFDAPAGTPIYFHVQNHGENVYQIVEFSVNGRSVIDNDRWEVVSRGVPMPTRPARPGECEPD